MSNVWEERTLVGAWLSWLIGQKEIQILIPWLTNVNGLDVKLHIAVSLVQSEDRVDEERWYKNVMNLSSRNNLGLLMEDLSYGVAFITTICDIQISPTSSLCFTFFICKIGLFALPPPGGCENSMWLVDVKMFWSKQNEENGGTL